MDPLAGVLGFGATALVSAAVAVLYIVFPQRVLAFWARLIPPRSDRPEPAFPDRWRILGTGILMAVGAGTAALGALYHALRLLA
jgi:hypothetical protein